MLSDSDESYVSSNSSSSDDDEGSDGNDINEEDELGTDVPIEDSEEQESSEELPDVDVTVVEQQVGEKETQKSDNKEESSSKGKPVWMGQRLFLPARKSKKPSKAWEFGGFNKDKAGQLIKDHTICGLCGKLQKYRNTRHILAEHSDKWKGEDESTLKNTRMDDFYLAQPSKIVNKYTADNPKQKAL